jgi:hypothetical protein
MSDAQYTLESVVENMKWFISHYGKATRDAYRKAEGKGAIPERVWGKYFSTFSEFKAAAIQAAEPQQGQTESEESVEQTLTGDHWNFTLVSRIQSLDELVKQFNVDLSVWEVERFEANSWEMGAIPRAVGSGKEWSRPSTELIITPLYQVRASFVKKKNIEAARQELEDLKKLYKESAHWPEPVIKPCVTSGNSLELLIPDLHAGKFAWAKETGHQDYDTPTAVATFERAVDEILSRAHGYIFEEIVLGVGNDLLNSDDYNSQTTKGTLVNSDTRYQKTYKAVREMQVRTIEKLRKHCKCVIVKVIPGNHDTQSTFTLGDSLECYFHNYDDVVIDNGPSPHKFYRWGKVLLGFTHGDKGKKTDYGLWMATERSKDFGETIFREIHIGHTHGLKVDEKFGVRVRTFAALCPPDAWHAAEHFVGNLRQAEAIVWNKEKGRIAEFIHTEID